jgi:hypothetical protein
MNVRVLKKTANLQYIVMIFSTLIAIKAKKSFNLDGMAAKKIQ